jgi:sugar diacid utilization regulator
MLPELDRATEEVIGAIQREVPEYARPQDDSYTVTLRRAVHQALHQFVQQIADPATPREDTAQLFRGIGRMEAAEGRSLEPLQAALRLHVHPQTVRYRLRQITSLFGPGLLDPDVRFGLEIALRVQQLLGGH